MTRPLALLALTGALGAAAAPAAAIPAFARRYQARCHLCHEGYPKLNPFGQRFEERGFRMETEALFDGRAWLRSVPVTLRASANNFFVEEGDSDTTGFFKAVSAGNLGERIAYWVDDAVLVTADDTVHVEPDNAWVRLEILKAGKLYLRGGRFELDLPFTQTRTPHLFSYEVYFANTGFESDGVGGFQDGVEVGGALPADVRWSAAVVKGRNDALAAELTDEAEDFDGNLFLRIRKRIGRDRFGLFAYLGRNTLAVPVPCAQPLGRGCPGPLVWMDDLLRLGADADLWLGRLNVYGVFVHGSHDNSIATPDAPRGTGESLSFDGGFVQGDYHLRHNVVVTARLNVVRQPPRPSAGDARTFTSVFPGLQLFVFERLKLSFEYGWLNQDRNDFGALQVALAF